MDDRKSLRSLPRFTQCIVVYASDLDSYSMRSCLPLICTRLDDYFFTVSFKMWFVFFYVISIYGLRPSFVIPIVKATFFTFVPQDEVSRCGLFSRLRNFYLWVSHSSFRSLKLHLYVRLL